MSNLGQFCEVRPVPKKLASINSHHLACYKISARRSQEGNEICNFFWLSKPVQGDCILQLVHHGFVVYHFFLESFGDSNPRGYCINVYLVFSKLNGKSLSQVYNSCSCRP